MAIGFKHGATGGVALGITIVPGTTRPTDPKENTIWANSKYGMRRWSISPSYPMRESWQKNLIVYPYYETTHTEDGVTFTDNKDGTITANGTATAESNFRFSYQSAEDGMFLLRPGTYTLSGCPAGGGSGKFLLLLTRLNDSGNWEVWKNESGNGNSFTCTKDTLCCVLFRVYKGAKVENLTVRPQLEAGSAATSWVMGNATGQVWVKTAPGSTVSMNTIKGKNDITVEPISVYEYTTGSGWKKRDAEVYLNGAWTVLEEPAVPEVSWDGYYFKDGEQYTDITGGWKTDGFTNTGTATVGDALVVSAPASSHFAAVCTEKTIDLTNANKLWFDSPSGNNGYGFGYLCATTQKSALQADIAASVTVVAGGGSMDVRSLSGAYHICLFASGGAYADVRAVWVE